MRACIRDKRERERGLASVQQQEVSVFFAALKWVEIDALEEAGINLSS